MTNVLDFKEWFRLQEAKNWRTDKKDRRRLAQAAQTGYGTVAPNTTRQHGLDQV